MAEGGDIAEPTGGEGVQEPGGDAAAAGPSTADNPGSPPAAPPATPAAGTLRAVDIALAGIAVAIIAYTLVRTRGILVTPDGLPAWDAAGYLLEGLKSAIPLAAFDIKTLLGVLLRPDLHPPLHSFLLGVWLAVFGNEMSVVRTFPFVLYIVGLGLLVGLGQRFGGRSGRNAALGAAVLFTLSVEGVRYITTPMTENTALVFELLALGLAVWNVDRTDTRSRLLVGSAVVAASLTRYNLAPMLLVPLFFHHVWRHLRNRRALLDPRVLLFAAPTVGTLLLWQLLRSDLARNIKIFFENRSSGLEFWSVENLAWVPITLAKSYLNSTPLAIVLATLFLMSLAPSVVGRDLTIRLGPVRWTLRHSEGLRLLHAFLLVSFGALTWHDYKIDRGLHGIAPLVYLSALWALGGLQIPGRALVFAPVVLLLGVGLPLGYHQFSEAIPGLAAKSDFRPEPPVIRSLEFIEAQARKRKQIWVTGWVFRLSPNLIEYWLKSRGVPAKIKLDSPLWGEKTRTGIDGSWNDKYPEYVMGTMLTPENVADTSYITIEIVPGTRYWDGWMSYGNNYARAFSEQSVIPEVDRVEFIDEGLTVRGYGAGEEQSQETLEALYNKPKPEDDVGIELPPGEPFFRETFNKRAKWTVVPPWSKDKVKLTRGSTTLTVEIPEPVEKLQLCGPSPKVPANYLGVLHVTAKGLTGRTWFHYRGIDEKEALLTNPTGGPDIVQVGPFKAEGRTRSEMEVHLSPKTVTSRLCVILDGVKGTLVLEDLALYGDAPVAAAAAPAEAADETPALYRESFDTAVTTWRVLPAAAAEAVKLAPRPGMLGVTVPQAQASAQVCGPAVDVPGKVDVRFNVHANEVTGTPLVQVRGLDALGALNKVGGVPDVTTLGTVTAGAAPFTATVTPAAGTTRVRPCLVLDGAAGSFQIDEVRISE